MSNDMSSNSNRPDIVPFGKYKGQPADVLASDPQYVEWLNGQGWVKDKYPQFYTVIINNFQEPSDTPEHNALQAMFLDDVLCCQLLNAAATKTDIPEGMPSKEFEFEGADVSLSYYAYTGIGEHVPYWRCAIELKPSIGDDFPAIFRRIQQIGKRVNRGGHRYDLFNLRIIVFRDFVAAGATLEQVRAMFEHSGVLLFSLGEIQQASLIRNTHNE